jgi:hypothetical protein
MDDGNSNSEYDRNISSEDKDTILYSFEPNTKNPEDRDKHQDSDNPSPSLVVVLPHMIDKIMYQHGLHFIVLF